MNPTLRKTGKLIRLLQRPHVWNGLRHGVAATIEHERFLKSRRFNTIIDAGANKGQFSLEARAIYSSANIIAFEPLVQPASLYKKLFDHDKKIQFKRIALGAKSGETDIHISRRNDSSSLLKIGKLQNTYFPGTDEVGLEHIQVSRLDETVQPDQLTSPTLLKIDVQGYELEVLKGAEKILPCVDDIYVELSFVEFYEHQPLAGEVITWLEAHDFRFAGVYATSLDDKQQAIQGDFHFQNLKPSGRAPLNS